MLYFPRMPWPFFNKIQKIYCCNLVILRCYRPCGRVDNKQKTNGDSVTAGAGDHKHEFLRLLAGTARGPSPAGGGGRIAHAQAFACSLRSHQYKSIHGKQRIGLLPSPIFVFMFQILFMYSTTKVRLRLKLHCGMCVCIAGSRTSVETNADFSRSVAVASIGSLH